jgi:hypothetical protein
MNEIESILFDWKAKELFGFVKFYKSIHQAENKTIYQVCLTSTAASHDGVPTIKLNKYFVPKGTKEDTNRLIDFLQCISNEIFLATIRIM